MRALKLCCLFLYVGNFKRDRAYFYCKTMMGKKHNTNHLAENQPTILPSPLFIVVTIRNLFSSLLSTLSRTGLLVWRQRWVAVDKGVVTTRRTLRLKMAARSAEV